jgi:hypothetical protein
MFSRSIICMFNHSKRSLGFPNQVFACLTIRKRNLVASTTSVSHYLHYNEMFFLTFFFTFTGRHLLGSIYSINETRVQNIQNSNVKRAKPRLEPSLKARSYHPHQGHHNTEPKPELSATKAHHHLTKLSKNHHMHYITPKH